MLGIGSILSAAIRRALLSSTFSSSSSPSPSSSLSSIWRLSRSAAAVSDEELIFTTSSSSTTLNPTLLQPGVVIYDGVCHLCHKGVKWVIKADKYKVIKFCCVQSRAAEPYLNLCGVTREDVLRRFIFIEGPGLYHQASTAALKVASHLPLPYSALSALLIIPAPLRDAVYDYVARRRYNWFRKEGDCIVLQEKELLDRFVDRDEMFGRHHGSKFF